MAIRIRVFPQVSQFSPFGGYAPYGTTYSVRRNRRAKLRFQQAMLRQEHQFKLQQLKLQQQIALQQIRYRSTIANTPVQVPVFPPAMVPINSSFGGITFSPNGGVSLGGVGFSTGMPLLNAGWGTNIVNQTAAYGW